MGTQGLSGRALLGGRGDGDASWLRIAALAVSFAILPLATGCSSSSVPSFGSSNPQAAAVPPPAQPGYPQQAQAGNPQPASYAPAAQPASASEAGTVGSLKSGYVNFLKAFRDPDPNPSGDAARASVYPQRSLADVFRGSAEPTQRPDAGGAGYPQQALVPAAGGANPAQPNAYVPHPPSTYTPSAQPYTPPGQPAYAAPTAQQNYAPPPAYTPRSGQQGYATPSTQQTYAGRSTQQNTPPSPAYNAPPPAAPAPAAQRDYSDSLPYPKQSLADVFRGSTESQTQGQAASGAQAASAPRPATPEDSLPYPKQSLFEVFSGK